MAVAAGSGGCCGRGGWRLERERARTSPGRPDFAAAGAPGWRGGLPGALQEGEKEEEKRKGKGEEEGRRRRKMKENKEEEEKDDDDDDQKKTEKAEGGRRKRSRRFSPSNF
eukprot:EG_transcript_30149